MSLSVNSLLRLASFVLMLDLAGCTAIPQAHISSKPKRVVFIGDSITQFWELNDWFPGAPYTNTGIERQVTSEILARFQSDAIAPAPNIIVILAGTNDVLHYLSVDQAATNLRSMVVEALAANIKAVVCTVPPVDRDISAQQGSQYVGDFNQELQHLNAVISSDPLLDSGCDYHRVLSDPMTGLPLPGVLKDGVHPSPAGYQLMANEVSKFLK